MSEFPLYALAGYASDRSTGRSKSAHSVYFWNTLTDHYDAPGDTPRCPAAVPQWTISQLEMAAKGDFFCPVVATETVELSVGAARKRRYRVGGWRYDRYDGNDNEKLD